MDRDKVYEITPLVGVADVKFGMSPEEVEAVWGAPKRTSKNSLGNRTEIREARVLTYDSSTLQVAEIGFPSSYQNLILRNIKLFQIPPQKTIDELRQLDGEAYEGDGFIVFKNIGISLSGFRRDDLDGLTVTVFRKGWWDRLLEDMAKLA